MNIYLELKLKLTFITYLKSNAAKFFPSPEVLTSTIVPANNSANNNLFT